MIHAILLSLTVFGLSLLGVVWLALVVKVIMYVIFDASSAELFLARTGLRFIKHDKVLFASLFPSASKFLADPTQENNAEMSTHSAEELEADLKKPGGLV
jgi:hypothetical protein